METIRWGLLSTARNQPSSDPCYPQIKARETGGRCQP